MKKKIQKNAKEAGLSNYDSHSSIWQEVDVNGLSKLHDITFSSTVIWIFRNIVEQNRQIEKVSSGHCFLCAGIDTIGHCGNELWNVLLGDKPIPTFPEYPLTYDILYEDCIHPEVRIIEYESRISPRNIMKMHQVFCNHFTDMNPEKEEIISDYVMSHLEGCQYLMIFKIAVIWWKASDM